MSNIPLASRKVISGAPNMMSSEYPLLRKPIRRHAHSCVECRRRKIRCYFETDVTICSPCLNRGSQCIDQRSAANRVGTTHRATAEWQTNNRHKALASTRLHVTEQTTAASIQFCEKFSNDHTNIDNRAPLISTLSDARLLQSAQSSSPTTATPFLKEIQAENIPANDKSKSICETLRAALPSYDVVMSALTNNGMWWTSYQKTICSLSGLPLPEPRETFAARAYTSANPGELGTLAVAFSRSSAGYDHLVPLVENLVVSDFAYLATVEGMICLTLLVKVHADNGQPRKSFYVLRRGMAVAQLMGWYQIGTASPAQRAIWWEIYQCDRLTSLLLGLPYGFNDAHYGDILERMANEATSPVVIVVLKSTFLAGRIIDRNLAMKKLSFAHSVDLDEQMAQMAKMMPDDWWALPPDPQAPQVDKDDLRERIALQFFFFHVIIYIHLPFIGNTSTDLPYDVNRSKCMGAAREMLKRFIMFRVVGQDLGTFECKTTNFIGFTAALVLLICRSKFAKKAEVDAADSADRYLVTSTEEIFAHLESQGCKIAAQCVGTLRYFNSSRDRTGLGMHSQGSESVRIPYFGTVMKKWQGSTPQPQLVTEEKPNYEGCIDIPPNTNSNAENEENNPSLGFGQYSIEYQGIDATTSFLDGASSDFGNMTGDYFSSMVDIDQDWGIFMSESCV